LACAAGLAAVNEIRESDLPSNAERVGKYFQHLLRVLPGVSEVRGLGLMIAAEFEAPKAKSVAQEALEKGLIVNPIGDSILRFVPPLIITMEQMDRAFEILSSCL